MGHAASASTEQRHLDLISATMPIQQPPTINQYVTVAALGPSLNAPPWAEAARTPSIRPCRRPLRCAVLQHRIARVPLQCSTCQQ
jgi:hypothetical protein